MIAVRRARAGRYAQQRYKRAYKAYRRRMRAPLLICVLPMYGFFLYVVATHKLDVWTTAAVTVGGGATWLVMFVRDEAPQHILNWRRGAEGERKTEKALRKLERAGWTVEHDLQQEGRANVDHIVRAVPQASTCWKRRTCSGPSPSLMASSRRSRSMIPTRRSVTEDSAIESSGRPPRLRPASERKPADARGSTPWS
jgi:hypothetical protein